MPAKKKPKTLYIIWNDEISECADNNFYLSAERAKEVASDLNEDFTYSIWECKLVAEEARRAIIWKAPA